MATITKQVSYTGYRVTLHALVEPLSAAHAVFQLSTLVQRVATFDLLTPISEDRKMPLNYEEQALVPEVYRALASDTSKIIVIHPLFDDECVLELRLATSNTAPMWVLGSNCSQVDEYYTG